MRGMVEDSLHPRGQAIAVRSGVGRLGGRQAPAGGGRAPEPLLLLDEEDRVAGRGGFQRRGDSGDASADHQQGLRNLVLQRVQGLGLERPRDAHTKVVLREHLSIFVARRVAPRYVFPKVDALDDRPVVEAE